MLGFLESLAKAAVAVAVTPVAVVADVVTLGGTLNDRDETYTETAFEAVVKNLEDAIEP